MCESASCMGRVAYAMRRRYAGAGAVAKAGADGAKAASSTARGFAAGAHVVGAAVTVAGGVRVELIEHLPEFALV